MKRTILTLITIMCCLLADAQITNKIRGLTLDKSTLQQVMNVINAKHLTTYEKKSECITCFPKEQFQFGGEKWDMAFFNFYKGKLCSIHFLIMRSTNAKASFERLKSFLNDKYSDYVRDKNLHSIIKKYVDYDDGKTTVSVTLASEEIDYVGLRYFDDNLAREVARQIQSEL